MATSAVSVTTAATALVAENFERIALVIDNQSAQTVYWGDASTITTASGATLEPGERLVLAFDGGAYQYFFSSGLWGIVTAGTADVRVVEFVRTR